MSDLLEQRKILYADKVRKLKTKQKTAVYTYPIEVGSVYYGSTSSNQEPPAPSTPPADGGASV